jgi:hypothetical protein
MNIIGSKQKLVEVDGRQFCINKYSAFIGIKIAKTFVAKVLPVFQSFLPIIQTAAGGGTAGKEEVLANLDKFLDFENLSRALDLVSSEDLELIMKHSLMVCSEPLGAGPAPVMNADGTYGVPNIEYDPVLVLRLVCEAVIWGLGDFFDGGRLTSIMSPLSSSLPLSQ